MNFAIFLVLVEVTLGYIVRPDGIASAKSLKPACDYAVDVAQLIDVSYSQDDNVAALKSDSDDVLSFIEASNGLHRLAMATFVDKPIAPVGWDTEEWTDYCLKLQAPFGSADEQYLKAINSLNIAGGYDFAEGQLEAVLRAAISDEFEWRTTTEHGIPVKKVVLVATDSIAHVEGDAAAIADVTPNELTTEILAREGLNARCASTDYPSLKNLSKILKEKEVVLVFLVSPAVFSCTSNASGLCVFPELLKIAKETGNPDYADAVLGLQLYYTTLLEEMDITGVVVPMGQGFKGYGDALKAAVYDVGHIVCNEKGISTLPGKIAVNDFEPGCDTACKKLIRVVIDDGCNEIVV